MSTNKNRQAAVVADSRLTVLVNSETGAKAVNATLPSPHDASRIHVLQECSRSAAQAENLLVFSAASTLERVAECVSMANKAHRLVALLVESDVDTNWLPYVFHRNGLRALRNMIVHSDADLPLRILNAWAIGGEHDFIADAAVINDELVVRTCALDEYSMSFDEYPALSRIPESARSGFVFEDDGLLLAWPQYQVHLDVEDIRFSKDPARRKAARARRIADQRAIGGALKRLRQKAGLKQSGIEGISERQVRRIEAGEGLGADALDAYAAALDLDADALLDLVSEMIDEPEESLRPIPSVATNRSEDPSAAAAAVKVIYSHPKAPKGRGGGAVLSEGLRLAAETVSELPSHRWDLPVEGHGILQGRLEHDYTTDELFFVIDDLSVSKLESSNLTLTVWTKGNREPLETHAFVPRRGVRVSLSRNRAILPSDVTKLSARLEHER